MDDGFVRRCVGWQRKWCLLPRRCFYSNKLLWFKRAHRGMSILTGPGDCLFDYRWVDSKEFLLLKIKGTL